LERNKPVPKEMSFQPTVARANISCASAEEPLVGIDGIDVCLFDPPYFDYIAYSELSEFYRVWHTKQSLGGVPLLPNDNDPSGSFGRGLGRCLTNVLKLLRPNRPIAFTFHSSSKSAWEAIALALDQNNLAVTAMWPILNDPHMGHHGGDGNCEWDVVVVCRRADESQHSTVTANISAWAAAVRPLKIRRADRRSMRIAVEVLESRFAHSSLRGVL
jgi:adenine-specific DNA methylase